jgi:hypothetical protein
VSCGVPRFKLDRVVLVLTGAMSVAAWASPARAAGCHVPERPVLSRSLSWELWSLGTASPGAAKAAPPAVRRLPCEGETPAQGSPATTFLEPACLASDLVVPVPEIEPLARKTPPTPPAPISPRLDRPPRNVRSAHLLVA